MLYYTEADLSPLEVPGERALCIYISGCMNRCPNCHYPELQHQNYGSALNGNFEKLVLLYRNYCTCICFMGEGENTPASRRELAGYSRLARACGLRTCLYCGRDTGIESWMRCFDYIKLGSYQPRYGPIDQPGTNQRMYQRHDSVYTDVTFRFLTQPENSSAPQ